MHWYIWFAITAGLALLTAVLLVLTYWLENHGYARSSYVSAFASWPTALGVEVASFLGCLTIPSLFWRGVALAFWVVTGIWVIRNEVEARKVQREYDAYWNRTLGASMKTSWRL